MKSWKPPTRRAFVAMLGAGAAMLAMPKPVAATPKLGPPDEDKAPALPRWIGHC
ncbi:MAG: twin-arginine translocation signal domain-containing protein [Kofleriaceae bacterium]